MSGPSIRGPQTVPAGELPAGEAVGEYRVLRKVAEGGMATVYAGVHPVIHKNVAIKVMRPVDNGDPRAVERFVAEARAVNEIAHPNIVDVFAFGTLADGRCYLIMDWLEGETLAARLAGKERVPLAEGLEILAQTAEALSAAHEKGIVHRDIKPANIHLVPLPKQRVGAKLLDFGISSLLVDERPPDATGQRHFLGTPRYTSPEQAAGAVGDTRSDVYALGVVAFEMFVGRAPFEAASTTDLLRMHIVDLPPAPSTLWPEIPLQLERLLVQMLDKAPARRPTLAEIAASVERVRGELNASAAQSARERDSTAVQLRRTGAGARWLVAALVVCAAGAAVFTYWPTILRLTVARVTPAADAPAANATPTRAATPTATPPAPSPAAPPPTAEAPKPVVPAATAAASAATRSPAHLRVDVDVRSLIRVDGRVVAHGRRALVEIAPGVSHLLVVSSPRRHPYRQTLIADGGSTVELAVRLRGARPSVKRRRVQPETASKVVADPPTSHDPNYTLNPFQAR